MVKDGYKQTEIGLIPEDWDIKQLGDIGEVEMCKRIFSYETTKNGQIPFYKIGTFGKEADTFIAENLYNSYRKQYSFPKIGSILISASGTIGKTIIYDGTPSYFQDSNIVWISNDEKLVSNQFLYHLLQVIKYESEGSTIQRLYNNIIKKAKFILPPIEEQKAIAKALSDTDDLIISLEKQISKKEAIKQGTMQQLLTGKKRLNGFSGDWEEKRLGDISSFLKGKGLPKSVLSNDGEYKCIHYGELFTTYKEIIKHIKSFTNQVEDTILSIENDILMPTSDVTPNGLATASCIKENGIILGGDILIIRANKNILDGCFFSFYISIDKNQIMQLISGSTVYHLYGSDMANFILKIPPTIKEQQAITQILSDMDKEIESLKSKLSKTKAIKDGIMSELLTGKTRLKVKDE